MSDELIDFRGKITVETDWFLDARATAENCDRSEIARKILHEAAIRGLHLATLLQKHLQVKGEPVASRGLPGSERTTYDFKVGR